MKRITEILRRIWLFSENNGKSSESFSKQTIQLIIKLTSSLRHIIVTIALFCFTQYLVVQDNCQEMALEVLWSHRIFDRLKTETDNFVLCYCEQNSCRENPDYQGCKFDRQIDICWQFQCPPNFLRHFPHNCINLP